LKTRDKSDTVSQFCGRCSRSRGLQKKSTAFSKRCRFEDISIITDFEEDPLHAASRIALNPDTGEIKRHLQTTLWGGCDYDGVNEVVSFNVGDEKLAACADRNGFFYVMDRTNGKLKSATPFVEEITWAKSIDIATGRPVY
jgi:glucose dehydrogenase